MSRSATGRVAAELDPATRVRLGAAKGFTKAYREHLHDHVAVREAFCLMQQYPALCRPIKKGDLFAGRRYYRPLAGFAAELNTNTSFQVLHDIPGYTPTPEDGSLRASLGISNSGFCHDYQELRKLAESYPQGHPERVEIEEMTEFWGRHSMRAKYNAALPAEIEENLGKTTGFDTRYASGFMRQDCFSLDYDKLLRLGIPGMRELVQRKRDQARRADGDPDLYTGMLLALDLLVNVCRHYEAEIRSLMADCENENRMAELREMADTLRSITSSRPGTLREAIQLFWIYNLVSDSPNYGRMDVYLGDFYCHDIDTGVLSEQKARELLMSLWRLISDIKPEGGPTQANARLVVGGRGRRNEENANRFALAAMDVSRAMRVNEPNLTLRFYRGQNPELMKKALDMLGESCVHPGLYNDEEHIPMVRDWHDVPEKDAEQYLPEGCGEILIDHMGFGSPNNILVFPCALDLVLHNGFDTVTEQQRGLPLGELAAFDTFDKLVDAFLEQVDHTVNVLARRHAIEHRVEAENAAFLFMSMLTDDCIERGRSLFDGGVRYLGGIIETFGLTNVADSLAAIKKLLYDRKAMTLRQLVEIVDADFAGHERERRMMLACPKFGNDDQAVDAIHTAISERVCRSAYEAGRKEGLHFFLNCNLNPGGMYYAPFTKASADGRRQGEPMALGNAPTAGRDGAGITALLNSMSKHKKCHAGYVQNIKVSKSLFWPEHRARFEALLETYFNSGGIQLMVTALNAEDLRNALKEPEKYTHLQVRVAGWTARFVELNEKYQQEILKRTLYC